MILKEVDRYEHLSKEEFQRKYYIPQKPVVFRNFSENWKARTQWDYAYLSSKVGDQMVEVHGAWKENNPTKIQMPPQTEMTFDKYLKLIGMAPNNFRLFLFDIFKLAPELKSEFDFPDIAEGWVKSHPYLFFGGQGADVRLHYDIDMSNVFLTQFQGKKRALLFAPEMSRGLYKQPFSTHSNIDLDNIDYDKYPALKKVEGYECLLEHGDTLFMPGGYWHYIQYITAGYSMALRTLNRSYMEQLKGAYNIFVIKTIDDLISKYYETEWADYKTRMARKLAETA